MDDLKASLDKAADQAAKATDRENLRASGGETFEQARALGGETLTSANASLADFISGIARTADRLADRLDEASAFVRSSAEEGQRMARSLRNSDFGGLISKDGVVKAGPIVLVGAALLAGYLLTRNRDA